MEKLLTNALIAAGLMAPVLLGLVEVVKATRAGSKYDATIVSSITGALGGIALALLARSPLPEGLLGGFICGLSASGLYDLVRPGIDKLKNKKEENDYDL